jgi:hypothetical protein
MHLCPHCDKLGISTYAALGDAFSRGLVTCRYCSNVSKARRGVSYYITAPIAMVLFWTLIAVVKPPMEFAYLWFAITALVALMFINRNIEFDKFDRNDAIPLER